MLKPHLHMPRPAVWLLAAVIYYLCLYLFYIRIGQNMGTENILFSIAPVLLLVTLVQFGSGVKLCSFASIPAIVVGLAWCTAFPLLYYWTYHTYWFQQLVFVDFLIGTANMLLIASLSGVLFRIGYRRIMAMLLAVLDFLLLIIPFVQYAYYCIVWHCLSPASLMAIYLTNYRESIDYIQSNVGLIPTIIILSCAGLLLWLSYRCHLTFSRLMDDDISPMQLAALIIVLIASMATLRIAVPQSSIAGLWHDVDTYVEQTQTYSQTHEERYNSLALDGTQTLAVKAPGTVIVVIGESESRNYMKAYTPDYIYDDTPWLDSCAKSPDFTLFQNAYSCWSQTVPVLQRALTEQSQYNGKEFFEASSIIDIASKAGYKTYWFSNQNRYGQNDSAITLVAKTADRAEWTDDSYDISNKLDEELMPLLQTVDPDQNNFIVLHIIGSHIYYNNRYPADFERFKTDEGSSVALSEASYANSVLYTDHNLQQIFEYAKEHLHLQAMLYFSDHGENLVISHNPDVFTFDMVRIPMFVYLSPEYQRALPQRTLAIRHHRTRYFTNDMIYDTVSGLINAPSNRYDEVQDFTSPMYGFTRDKLTTMLGQRKLTDDPDGTPETFF